MVKYIAFTMYPVKDMARARKFYEGTLGLELTKDFKGAWVEYHLENGCLALTTMAEGVMPSANAGGSIALEVDDLDATMKDVKAKGAAVKLEPFESPVCRMAVIADSEGNAVTLHQKKPGR